MCVCVRAHAGSECKHETQWGSRWCPFLPPHLPPLPSPSPLPTGIQWARESLGTQEPIYFSSRPRPPGELSSLLPGSPPHPQPAPPGAQGLGEAGDAGWLEKPVPWGPSLACADRWMAKFPAACCVGRPRALGGGCLEPRRGRPHPREREEASQTLAPSSGTPGHQEHWAPQRFWQDGLPGTPQTLEQGRAGPAGEGRPGVLGARGEAGAKELSPVSGRKLMVRLAEAGNKLLVRIPH